RTARQASGGAVDASHGSPSSTPAAVRASRYAPSVNARGTTRTGWVVLRRRFHGHGHRMTSPEDQVVSRFSAEKKSSGTSPATLNATRALPRAAVPTGGRSVAIVTFAGPTLNRRV